jgi:hypothetical protein
MTFVKRLYKHLLCDKLLELLLRLGRENMAYMRQSRPDSGSGFQLKVLKTLKIFPLRSAEGPEIPNSPTTCGRIPRSQTERVIAWADHSCGNGTGSAKRRILFDKFSIISTIRPAL